MHTKGANRTKAKPEAVAGFDLRWLKEQNRILKLQLKATPGIISRAVEIARLETQLEMMRMHQHDFKDLLGDHYMGSNMQKRLNHYLNKSIEVRHATELKLGKLKKEAE